MNCAPEKRINMAKICPQNINQCNSNTNPNIKLHTFTLEFMWQNKSPKIVTMTLRISRKNYVSHPMSKCVIDLIKWNSVF